jgi:hypothetical protein
VSHVGDEESAPIKLTNLDGVDLRRAEDGWHGIWRVDGVTHQFWLRDSVPDTSASFAVTLPMDIFLELRSHAARRLWRALNGRVPGPDFGAMPAQLRQFHILSLRALDARLREVSYRKIAEVLLDFRGRKEDWESDPRKNKTRRLVEHAFRMMRGDHRLLLHYPIKLPKR